MKKAMKLLFTLACLSSITTLSYAAKPGAYVGAGIGGSRLSTPDKYLFDVNPKKPDVKPDGKGTDGKGVLARTEADDPNKDQNKGNSTGNVDVKSTTLKRELGGIGGRVFAGYNFSNYLGMEAGYSHYAPSNYTGVVDGDKDKTSALKHTMNTIDLVGKAYLPIGESGFNLYGLAGASMMLHKMDYKDGGLKPAKDVVLPKPGSTSQNRIRPVVGAGASYDFPNTPVTAGLEFQHVHGTGDMNKNTGVPSANLVTFNLSYSFGN